jgi:hypothetical protein
VFPLETVSTPSAFSAEMLSVRHATQQWHAVPGDQLLGAPVVEPFERGAYFRLVAGALETQPLHETLYNRRMKSVLQTRSKLEQLQRRVPRTRCRHHTACRLVKTALLLLRSLCVVGRWQCVPSASRSRRHACIVVHGLGALVLGRAVWNDRCWHLLLLDWACLTGSSAPHLLLRGLGVLEVGKSSTTRTRPVRELIPTRPYHSKKEALNPAAIPDCLRAFSRSQGPCDVAQ